MSTAATIPIFAPDGTVRDVPYAQMHDALSNGGKLGMYMKDPQGQQHVVPSDQVQQAQKNGGTIVPYNLDTSHQDDAFWKTFLSDMGQSVKSAPSAFRGMFDPATVAQRGASLFQSDQDRQQQGAGLPYRAGAMIAQSAGTNVPGIEQAAAQGKPNQVLGHAVAGATPYAIAAASPLISKGAGALADQVSDAFPSKARASGNFNAVSAAAGDMPVDLTNSQPAILKLMDWQKTTNLGPTLNKFMQRITRPGQGPLTYDEARNFYQTLGNLSVDETNKLPKTVKYELKNMLGGLKQDIGNTAQNAGAGAQYYDAMNEYRNASQISNAKQAAGSFIVDQAKSKLPWFLTGLALKEVYDASK